MTGPEHYREAQRLLALANRLPDISDGLFLAYVGQAQVKATLAVAAAIATLIPVEGNESIIHDWHGAGAW
jgi:hypothetical protein